MILKQICKGSGGRSCCFFKVWLEAVHTLGKKTLIHANS